MTKASKAALLLLVAGLALGTLSLAAAPARAASVSYDLFGSLASGWGFTSTSETNPGPALTANVGDTVTITLHSTDGMAHQFLIDLNGNRIADSGEPVTSVFSSTATLTFTVSQAGTFHYICTIHGNAMTGSFTAQGTGTPAPGAPYSSSTSTLVIVGIVIAIAIVAVVSIVVLRSRN
jgi:plastocyanin